ncbi:MAG: two-component sensor histidine kinase, partial [Deltaproteobacteria bacterium]|nr:two-component sensor histidine kinase [Deltaproteobacteria bacterium]
EQRSCELDDQLIQSQKLAAIGELSSGIAHEINNPLAIIGQEVEWLRHLFETGTLQEEKDREEFADSLKQIASQVDRCRDITHKLLNFARKMDPVMQAVELNKLIDEMAALVEKEAKLNNINIIREFQKDLPLVTSDPPFLRQVILNLLNNATYAIEANGAITISTKDNKDGRVEIAVVDTGRGIPKEHLKKIFDPFFTTKPPGKGTGLGLSICHGIIQRVGGTISVISQLDRGTTFTIRLPIAP